METFHSPALTEAGAEHPSVQSMMETIEASIRYRIQAIRRQLTETEREIDSLESQHLLRRHLQRIACSIVGCVGYPKLKVSGFQFCGSHVAELEAHSYVLRRSPSKLLTEPRFLQSFLNL
jgi:hypothetical protein